MNVLENVLNHACGLVAGRAVFRSLNSWPSQFSWTDRSIAFFLSFDCDTEADALVLPQVVALLREARLKASFGVIGSLLREDPGPYQQALLEGHELFLHGDRRHTSMRAGAPYHSDLFYDHLSWAEIERELVEGKRTFETVLGIKPVGFRTPHFGSFQAETQLDGLYELLSRLGFRYSSSALMWNARRQKRLNPARQHGIVEFPLSVRVGPPISLIDSWNFIIMDRQRGRPVRLPREWDKALKAAELCSKPCFMNVYFDPSHIATFQDFSRMLADLTSLVDRELAWVGTYSQALGMKLQSNAT